MQIQTQKLNDVPRLRQCVHKYLNKRNISDIAKSNVDSGPVSRTF